MKIVGTGRHSHISADNARLTLLPPVSVHFLYDCRRFFLYLWKTPIQSSLKTVRIILIIIFIWRFLLRGIVFSSCTKVLKVQFAKGLLSMVQFVITISWGYIVESIQLHWQVRAPSSYCHELIMSAFLSGSRHITAHTGPDITSSTMMMSFLVTSLNLSGFLIGRTSKEVNWFLNSSGLTVKIQEQFLQRCVALNSRQQSPPSNRQILVFVASSQTPSRSIKLSAPHDVLSALPTVDLSSMSVESAAQCWGNFYK